MPKPKSEKKATRDLPVQLPEGHVQVEVLKPFNGYQVGACPAIKAADAAKWAQPGRDLVRVLEPQASEQDAPPPPEEQAKAVGAPPQDKQVEAPKVAK